MTTLSAVDTRRSAPPAADLGDYSLGTDDAERARLLAQCAIHRDEAALLLDRIGLGVGGRALDLGCGPLGVLDLPAERVGPTGQVVGLDRESRFLAMAARTLRERGVERVELVSADAEDTGLPGGTFDGPDTFTLYATFFHSWGRRPAAH